MPTIEVSEETKEKIIEQFGLGEVEDVNLDSLDDLNGEKWFFRTVTNYLVGKVEKRVGKFLVLKQASWIGDTKRFSDFIKKGVSENVEVEPVGMAMLNMDSIVDAFPWTHKLPTKQQ